MVAVDWPDVCSVSVRDSTGLTAAALHDDLWFTAACTVYCAADMCRPCCSSYYTSFTSDHRNDRAPFVWLMASLWVSLVVIKFPHMLMCQRGQSGFITILDFVGSMSNHTAVGVNMLYVLKYHSHRFLFWKTGMTLPSGYLLKWRCDRFTL